MPPPVPFSNRHTWYGPAGVGMDCPNFQPSTFSHHLLVACGSMLASSVCVMSPCRTLGLARRLAGAAALRAGRRAATCFFATFLRVIFPDFAFAMESSL